MTVLGIVKIIFLVVGLIGAVVLIMLLINDGKTPKTTQKVKNKTDEKKKNKSGIKKESVTFKTFDELIDFENIVMVNSREPVGLITRNKGNEFVGILEVSPINYNLLSTEEREILEYSFQSLINGLDFNTQIYIQSRNIDIDNYKKKYDKRLEELKSNIESLTQKIETISSTNDNTIKTDIDELQDTLHKKIDQYNYGIELTNYIIDRCENQFMLQKKYYFVLSTVHNESEFSETLSYDEIIQNAYSDILIKADTLKNSLIRGGLDGQLLSPFKVAEILYTSYNKEDSNDLKLENAIRSNFSHYCSTAETIESKAIKRNINELDDLKAKEIEKIKL